MNGDALTTADSETLICQSHLEALISGHAEINGALVSTVDGFEVAARFADKKSAAKLSAMTSSLLALSEAICVESNVGKCIDMMIEASSGRLLLMDIPRPGSQLLLTALCDRDATLGQVLWAVRRCREQIAGALSG